MAAVHGMVRPVALSYVPEAQAVHDVLLSGSAYCPAAQAADGLEDGVALGLALGFALGLLLGLVVGAAVGVQAPSSVT